MNFSVIYSIGLSAAVGIGGLIGVVLLARRERHFLCTTYWKWLAISGTLSLGVPIVTRWGGPGNASLADTFLLRTLDVGWGKVLIAYAMFAGVLLGGVVATLVKSSKK